MDHSDVSLYVMTPEFGAATQLEKIDMLDFADVIALNKFDKRGALDAIRDVKKQYMRNNDLWETPMDQMPVYGTIASQFNDPGMNSLYKVIMDKLVEKAEQIYLLLLRLRKKCLKRYLLFHQSVIDTYPRFLKAIEVMMNG